jgi:hypothetical protein
MIYDAYLASHDEKPLVLVGGPAYPLLPNLMRPYPRQNLNESEKIFNYRLSRARRCVECTFGIMTSKFRILTKFIVNAADNGAEITKTITVLRNMILVREKFNKDTAFTSLELNALNDQPETIIAPVHKNSSRIATDVRKKFTNYFVLDAGKVACQSHML